ncbi:MAG: hypothetical protein ACLRQF_00565 [Thomasclavelia ramosa]
MITLEVKDILEEICEKYDYQIHEMTFPMIVIHAGVAIERILIITILRIKQLVKN